MRLVLSLLALTTLIVPLATAHVIVCKPNNEGECVVKTIGDPDLPPHAAVFVAPCFCFHPLSDSHDRVGLVEDVLP